MSGHAYFDCAFKQCTLIVRSGAYAFGPGCHFESCVWHVDIVLHDLTQVEIFETRLLSLIKGSVIRATAPGVQLKAAKPAAIIQLPKG